MLMLSVYIKFYLAVIKLFFFLLIDFLFHSVVLYFYGLLRGRVFDPERPEDFRVLQSAGITLVLFSGSFQIIPTGWWIQADLANLGIDLGFSSYTSIEFTIGIGVSCSHCF